MDNKTTFETGSLAITATGTAEQLTAHRVPQGHHIVVRARPTNAGYIYPGESQVQAEAHNVELEPGASIALAVDNASDIWADCSVSGETVEWFFEVGYADA